MHGEKKAPEAVFIVGCGDIGRRVAAIMHKKGAAVAALARSPTSRHRLERAGITPVDGDLDLPGSLPTLSLAGQGLFYFAPPPGEGDRDPRLTALLAAIDPYALPERVVYIGTSGVYGDCRGDWVDESRPVNPESDRARRRLDAERQLQGWGADHRVTVVRLRVGGIFKPEQLPRSKIETGEPLLDPAACGYINRIHADDLATILVTAMHRTPIGELYNVSDGHPGTMSDYFLAVADALGLPRPPLIDWETAQQMMSPAMLSYLRESRRLDNRRLLAELGITLRYPDLATALAAIPPATNPLSPP